MLCCVCPGSYPDVSVMERGIKLIMDRQKPNGDWDKVVAMCLCVVVFLPSFRFIFMHNSRLMFTAEESHSCENYMTGCGCLRV